MRSNLPRDLSKSLKTPESLKTAGPFKLPKTPQYLYKKLQEVRGDLSLIEDLARAFALNQAAMGVAYTEVWATFSGCRC